ncbi:MAG: hypothetical protein Q9179_007990, partial [Wetmoreana sp. 5 TL-2023]
LETPPPDPRHAPNDKAPSPDVGTEKRTVEKEVDSKPSLGIYRPYRARHELYGAVPYELDGRNVDSTRKP